jgi:hypothetical protein
MVRDRFRNGSEKVQKGFREGSRFKGSRVQRCKVQRCEVQEGVD